MTTSIYFDVGPNKKRLKGWIYLFFRSIIYDE
jgi:hypothetical protein